MCDLNSMSKEERRNLVVRARGNYVTKPLYQYGDTTITGSGWEYDYVKSYTLMYEDVFVYSSDNLIELLDTENYTDRPINEDEIDMLRTFITLESDDHFTRYEW